MNNDWSGRAQVVVQGLLTLMFTPHALAMLGVERPVPDWAQAILAVLIGLWVPGIVGGLRK